MSTIPTMKHLLTTLSLVLLTLFAVTGYSQNRQAGKPFLFADFPTTIPCTEAQLSSLFTAAKGQNISISLANNFSLAGPVTSNQVKYSNLQTIIIKLSAFRNSLFSLSKQKDKDNRIIYVGRIINPVYSDGYELKRTTDGNYQLIKIDLEKILVNCSQ
jgi:hypothetical protein